MVANVIPLFVRCKAPPWPDRVVAVSIRSWDPRRMSNVNAAFYDVMLDLLALLAYKTGRNTTGVEQPTQLHIYIYIYLLGSDQKGSKKDQIVRRPRNIDIWTSHG